MQSVIQAKHLNPALKVSMDPGFEYTSLRRERLQPLIAYADYVFLNKSEKKNLGFNARSAVRSTRTSVSIFLRSTRIPPAPSLSSTMTAMS